jgi:hypothetical protein
MAMPLELAREMAKQYRISADWMLEQAAALDDGRAQHFQDGKDISKELAADLRHRAHNIEATVIGFERICAREELADAAAIPERVSVRDLRTS